MSKILPLFILPFLLAGCSSQSEVEVKETSAMKSVSMLTPAQKANFEKIYNGLRKTTFVSANRVCYPDMQFSCSKEGCTQGTPTVFTVYQQGYPAEDSKLYRCDEKGCDAYEATFNELGAFTTLQTNHPRGFVLKAGNDLMNNEYFEVVSLGLATLTSFGKCEYKDDY